MWQIDIFAEAWYGSSCSLSFQEINLLSHCLVACSSQLNIIFDQFCKVALIITKRIQSFLPKIVEPLKKPETLPHFRVTA